MIKPSLSPTRVTQLPRVLAFMASRTVTALGLVTASVAVSFVAQAQTDTTPPTATISAPSANARLSSLSGGISGTATDAGTGVASVSARLSRNWPNLPTLYWNGSSWQSTATNLTVSLGTANGSGTKTWTVTSTLPSGTDFAAGRYGLTYQAKDGANLTSTSQSITFYSGTDTVGPQLTVTSPAATGSYDASAIPTSLSGTVKDPLNTDSSTGSGVSSVFIRFMRAYNGVNEFWNSSTSSWSSSTTVQTIATLTGPDVNGVYNWSVTASLPSTVPSGKYYYWVETNDRCGNNSYTQPIIKVNPDDTTAPTVAVSSPTASQSVNYLTSITGTDSDSGSGVARVDVSLCRSVTVGGTPTTQYWNGSAWGTTVSYLSSRTEVGWTRNTGLPSGANLPAGNYSIVAKSYDFYGNVSSTATRNFSMAAPTVTAYPNLLTTVLKWSGFTGADHYAIKRATSPGGPYTTLASSVSGTSYIDSGLTDGTTYYYVITALTSANLESATSVEVSATANDGHNLILQGVAGDGEVNLGWPAASGVTSYKVYQGGTTPTLLTTTTSLTHHVTGLTNNTEYTFWVVGDNGGVGIVHSNPVHLIPVLNPNSFDGYYDGVDDVSWLWYDDPGNMHSPVITGTGYVDGTLPKAGMQSIGLIWHIWAPWPNYLPGAGSVDIEGEEYYSSKQTNWFWVSYGDPAPWVTRSYYYPNAFLISHTLSGNSTASSNFIWKCKGSGSGGYYAPIGPTNGYENATYIENDPTEVRDQFITEEWMLQDPLFHVRTPDSSSSAHVAASSFASFTEFLLNPRAYVP